MLEGNRHVVEGLRDTLLAREELIGDEITAAIHAAAGVSRPSVGECPRTRATD
jgi:hypothetical protein